MLCSHLHHVARSVAFDAVKVWKSSFGWLSLNYFGGASVAFLLVGYNRTINLGYVGASRDQPLPR